MPKPSPTPSKKSIKASKKKKKPNKANKTSVYVLYTVRSKCRVQLIDIIIGPQNQFSCLKPPNSMNYGLQTRKLIP